MLSPQTSPAVAVTHTPDVVQSAPAPAATAAEVAPKAVTIRARKTAQPAAQKPRTVVPSATAAAKAIRKTTTRPTATAASKAAVKSTTAAASKTTRPTTRHVATTTVAAQTTSVSESTGATGQIAAGAVVVPKPEKLLKEKKPKLVRDSFTMPKLEYLLLDQLKQRSGLMGVAVKKSELLRAGIKALAEMPDASLLSAIKAVPTIKTGRPLKD